MTTYSNPRTHAVIENWPLSARHRGTATFTIEQHPKGNAERAVRTTIGAPKKLTYAVKQRIVDGDDGRTYIVCLSIYGSIGVMKGDMKFQHEWISQDDSRIPELMALFN